MDRPTLILASAGCRGCVYAGTRAPDCITCAQSGEPGATGNNYTPIRPPARKDDGGKLDMNLLDDMPRALKAVVEVMQWAVEVKDPPYQRGSWLGVAADRYRAAIKRHDRDATQQASTSGRPARFERDGETRMLHLSHLACSALMALENVLREEEANAANLGQ
jgi:hypothetical protein